MLFVLSARCKSAAQALKPLCIIRVSPARRVAGELRRMCALTVAEFRSLHFKRSGFAMLRILSSAFGRAQKSCLRYVGVGPFDRRLSHSLRTNLHRLRESASMPLRHWPELETSAESWSTSCTTNSHATYSAGDLFWTPLPGAAI